MLESSPAPSDPSPRFAAPLSKRVEREISEHYIKKFDRDVASLIHTMVYRLVRVQIECAPYSARVTGQPLREKFESVSKAMRQHIEDMTHIKMRIAETDEPDAKCKLFAGTIQPFLAGLQETANLGFMLNRQMIQEVENLLNKQLSCDRANLPNGLRHFQVIMRGLAYHSHRQNEEVDINRLVFEFRNRADVFEPSSTQPHANVVEHDLRFAFERFFELLHWHRIAALKDAFSDAARDNRLFRELDEDLVDSPARQLIDSARSIADSGTLTVQSDGTITYLLKVAALHAPHIEKVMPAFKRALEPVEELLASQYVQAKLDYSAQNKSLSFEVSPLSLSQGNAMKWRDFENEVEQARSRREVPFAMQYFALLREVSLPNGTKCLYEVTLPGAAFLSERAWGHVHANLKNVDSFIASCPLFGAVYLHRSGGEEDVVQSFHSGNYEIELFARSPYSIYLPRHEQDAQDAWDLTLPWQKQAPHPLDIRAGAIEQEFAKFSKSGIVQVSFSSASFEMAPIRLAAARVCALAAPRQFSVFHDQEAQIRGTEVALNPFTRKMLIDLERVLGEQKQRSPNEALSFMLINNVAIWNEDIGRSDKVYELRIFDSTHQEIASAEFLRSTEQFMVREYDLPLEKVGIPRIMSVLEQFRQYKHVNMEQLEDALLSAKIYIPPSTLRALADALSTISTQGFFGPANPYGIVASLFRRADMQVRVEGDTLKFRRRA